MPEPRRRREHARFLHLTLVAYAATIVARIPTRPTLEQRVCATPARRVLRVTKRSRRLRMYTRNARGRIDTAFIRPLSFFVLHYAFMQNWHAPNCRFLAGACSAERGLLASPRRTRRRFSLGPFSSPRVPLLSPASGAFMLIQCRLWRAAAAVPWLNGVRRTVCPERRGLRPAAE